MVGHKLASPVVLLKIAKSVNHIEDNTGQLQSLRTVVEKCLRYLNEERMFVYMQGHCRKMYVYACNLRGNLYMLFLG